MAFLGDLLWICYREDETFSSLLAHFLLSESPYFRPPFELISMSRASRATEEKGKYVLAKYWPGNNGP